MLITLILSLTCSGNSGDARPWRNYEEVFDLAQVEGQIYAATNGGLLCLNGSSWDREESPSALREISGVAPLTLDLADGSTVQIKNGVWTQVDESHRTRSLADGLVLGPVDPWNLGGMPPPSHPYSALSNGGVLFVGTNDGLYVRGAATWSRVSLPSELPTSRPNGVAAFGSTYLVGGISGLFLGHPGGWNQICSDSIRQVFPVGEDCWVVHGNGAVDKVALSTGQLWPDSLFGSAKRPWASCISQSGSNILFGGQGGWIERGTKPSENYPANLQGDVVLSILGDKETRWVGTEKSGLFKFTKGRERSWNPGCGLPDTTVTSICKTFDGIMVGTAHNGLFQIVGERIKPLKSPTLRVTALAQWNGRLVVGGMDGCWASASGVWKSLNTEGEETTSLHSGASGLSITTAQGIYFRKTLNAN